MENKSNFDKPVLLEVKNPDNSVATYNVAPLLKFIHQSQGKVDFEELGEDLQEDVNNLALGYNEISDNDKNRLAYNLVNLTKCFKAMRKL